jgi:hypothetical protein
MKSKDLEDWDKAMDAWDKCSCLPKRLCPHAAEVRKASEALDKSERIQLRVSKNRDAAPSPMRLVWNTNLLLDTGEAPK